MTEGALMKRSGIATSILILGVLLGGCAADVPAEPPAPEPEATDERVEVERAFDPQNPCALLTGEQIAEAMGVPEYGEFPLTGMGSQRDGRRECGWAFSSGSVEPLNVSLVHAGDRGFNIRYYRYEAPPQCYGGMPCATPAEYLEAWAADRMEFFLPLQADPSALSPTMRPDLLGGASAVGTQGIIFLDDDYIAEVRINGCTTESCGVGVVGALEAIDAQLR